MAAAVGRYATTRALFTDMSDVDDVLPEHTSAVIVLLAAGESRRYGGIKQLADIDGEPMVRRAALAALACNAPVIVVVGAHGDLVSAALADLPLLVVNHPSWSDGMGSSLAAGVRAAQQSFPRSSGVLVCVADQPLMTAQWLVTLLHRHQSAPSLIFAVEHQGIAGPPVLFPRDCFDTLMHWSGTRGASALLEREAFRVERLVAPDGDGMDVDTPEDLQRARAQLSQLSAS